MSASAVAASLACWLALVLAGGTAHRRLPSTPGRWRIRPPHAGAPAAELLRTLAAVAAGLRAGGSAAEVWQSVTGFGGDVQGVPTVGALLAGATDHRGAVTRHAIGVIAACRVAAELGAPLAPVLERAAITIEAELTAESESDAALAGPRQTVRLLTWLPLWGVLLGLVVGASPVRVLLDGGVGSVCLVGGVVCSLVGRCWMRRLLARTRAAGLPGTDDV